MKLKTLLLTPALLLIACSAISTLQSIVDTTELAIPILQASGVPIPPIALTYVTDVAACVAGQNGSTSPTDAQLLAIAACLGMDVAPTLPPGTGQAIVSIIATLVKDVSAFLSQHPAPAPTPGIKPHAIHLSPADSTKLAQMEAKAVSQLARLKAIAAAQPKPPTKR